MIQTIQPREYFPVSRILPDPNDSSTYYLRAVVRNAASGAVIETLDLASQGNHIYAYSWQAPADPSGRGLFVTVVTTVYTDSGYTTKSAIHAEEQDTYLVYDRFSFVSILANQISALSGGDIDYKKIRKIMKEEIQAGSVDILKAIADIKFDLTPVLEALVAHKKHLETCFDPKFEALLSQFRQIIVENKPEEAEKLNLTPVLEALQLTKDDIWAKIIENRPEKVNFEPIMQALEKYAVEVKVAQIPEAMTKMGEVVTLFSDMRKSLMDTANFKSTVLGKTEEEKKEEKPKEEEPYIGPQINKAGKLVYPRKKLK